MASRSLLPRLTQRRTTAAAALRARPEPGPGATGPGAHQHHGRNLGRSIFTSAAASHASSRTQIYISRTTDPLANLSLEHRLLQASHPDSTVLVLYVNRPTVVFGRNQNPWLEVNLAKLSAGVVSAAAEGGSTTGGAAAAVGLLRRRSGGGTVFHDGGNVNFGVICPPAAFDRDRHAEMVARALRRLGQPTARVNERHDIVIDVDLDGQGQAADKETRKVSGSAYKLTRLRSLHHGTCLVDSPNLGLISPLLRSPAEPYVKARGVDSVRSPVANAGGAGRFGVDEFRDAVAREFEAMHGVADIKEEFGDEVLLMPDGESEGEGKGRMAVADGARELGSRDWLYGQTPRFTFSTAPTGDDPRERPGEAAQRGVFFEAKRGVIDRFELDGVSQENFLGRSLCDVDWASSLAGYHTQGHGVAATGEWMDTIMGTAFTREGSS